MTKKIALPLDKIRFAYLEGASIEDIATTYRVGSWVIKDRIKELGLLDNGQMAGRGNKKAICQEQLMADYMALMTQAEIAKKYKVSQVRISQALKAIGLSWRDVPGRGLHLRFKEKPEEPAPTPEEIASLLAYKHVKAALFKENRNAN
jgi:transposase